ncbi:MAG: hypothetical protein JWM98_2028, partial [Thermoleophilia bacterium]|nr:hypothetical protein [Thermoleophilia bacterium]
MAARRSGYLGTHSGASLPPSGPERRVSGRIDSRIRATVRLADETEEAPGRARLV